MSRKKRRHAEAAQHTEKRVPEHTRSALQLRTPADFVNEQTIKQLALRIWAALVGEMASSGMSALIDELLESRLLDDDDDEEGDNESWLDDRHKRERKILDEAIADGLDRYLDINTLSLVSSSDPEIARDVERLKDVLTLCAMGATEIKGTFSCAQLEQKVKQNFKTRVEKDPEYSKHIRGDVPGMNIKPYGSWGRTSSKGTFVKTNDYARGGGLDTLFTAGWTRVARDRIDPVA